MDAVRVWRFVESHPYLAGLVPAVGYALAVSLLWTAAPGVAFRTGLAAELTSFVVLLVLRSEREVDPSRDFGEPATYEEGGFAEALAYTFAPRADDARRAVVLQVTSVFLLAVLCCSIALTLGGGRAVATALSAGG